MGTPRFSVELLVAQGVIGSIMTNAKGTSKASITASRLILKATGAAALATTGTIEKPGPVG